MTDPHFHLYRRDVVAVRNLATEVIRQCDHFERNTARGHDDVIRVLLIATCTERLNQRAQRAPRRYWRVSSTEAGQRAGKE